jgi:hypothetical protein
MKHFTTYFCIILLFFLSCKREKDYCTDTPKISYTYISSSSIELTQYFTNPKFDTISFNSSKGDTLIFVKTKTDSTWYDDEKFSGVPGCGPLEIQKNMEITNYYSTIKGDGIFRVKHSTLTKAAYNNNVTDNVIEVYFLNNHFYFFERHFNKNSYPLYKGDFILGDTTFTNTFYGYPDLTNTKMKGYMAPGFGLIAINDLENNLSYEILK